MKFEIREITYDKKQKKLFICHSTGWMVFDKEDLKLIKQVLKS